MLNFNIFYKKNDNQELFNYLKNNKHEHTIHKIQNYIPIYERFFDVNETNWNTINLNHKYSINNIKKAKTSNIFNISIVSDKATHSVESFFKFSPLIDPTKYMAGKYKETNQKIIETLPKFNQNKDILSKINNKDNSAYVDSFFSYLSSQLLHNYNFVHGIDFYGSFLGIKDKFKYNITDDLEYLYDYDYFHKNNGELFTTDKINEEFLEDDTRKNRKKISVNSDIDIRIETLDNSLYEDVFQELTVENLDLHNEIVNVQNSNIDLGECVFNSLKDVNYKKTDEIKSNVENKTNSECSSRESETSNEEDSGEDTDEETDREDDTDDNMDSSKENRSSGDDYSEGTSFDDSESSCSSGSNKSLNIFAEINNFPTQVICLEKLDNTLDSLMEDEDYELTTAEWKSCLFQVIITLIVYQNIYDFTHNDLHTNNIMFTKTDRKFLNYKYKDQYYKVPTYGRIFKIIDFGRSIYKYSGEQMCSDSFFKNGDAAGQFNFYKFENTKKEKILPNKGFDLCRLACSIYDNFIDDNTDEIDIKNPIAMLMNTWIKDDNGKNILYKSNGEERYPDFKLYKMITRKCSKNTPEAALQEPLFNSYKSSKKKIGKKAKIMNLDKYPKLF